MGKVKVPAGLAGAILVAAYMAGWQTALIVFILMLIFIEMNDNVKGVMVRVLTFMIGLALFMMLWSLIQGGYGMVYDSIRTFFNIISSYLEDPIDVSKLYQYLLDPIKNIISICDNIIVFLYDLAKFGFLIALLAGKQFKENFFVRWVNNYVDKAINFIKTIETPSTKGE